MRLLIVPVDTNLRAIVVCKRVKWVLRGLCTGAASGAGAGDVLAFGRVDEMRSVDTSPGTL